VQRLIASFYRSQIRFAVIAAIGIAFISGIFATTRAQGQQCRNFGNVTVCYDAMYEEGGIRYYEGNLKVGYKGLPRATRWR
jgi:hypothetical protein